MQHISGLTQSKMDVIWHETKVFSLKYEKSFYNLRFYVIYLVRDNRHGIDFDM